MLYSCRHDNRVLASDVISSVLFIKRFTSIYNSMYSCNGILLNMLQFLVVYLSVVNLPLEAGDYPIFRGLVNSGYMLVKHLAFTL